MKPGEMTDEEFYRALELRAELIALKLALASWRRRIRELEGRIRVLRAGAAGVEPASG